VEGVVSAVINCSFQFALCEVRTEKWIYQVEPRKTGSVYQYRGESRSGGRPNLARPARGADHQAMLEQISFPVIPDCAYGKKRIFA
ncbi:hypothetical protein RZS08_54870, partial [Arthrospira platensis SPKY1]|nr:hypothetical protein [Arthrospira platensis SPKY1]